MKSLPLLMKQTEAVVPAVDGRPEGVGRQSLEIEANGHICLYGEYVFHVSTY